MEIETKKETGYKVSVRKWIAEDGEYIGVAVSINPEFRELLKAFACKTTTTEIFYSNNNERYLITKVLKKSERFCSDCGIFFNKVLLDSGKLELHIEGLDDYQRLIMNLKDGAPSLVRAILQLKNQDNNVEITVTSKANDGGEE